MRVQEEKEEERKKYAKTIYQKHYQSRAEHSRANRTAELKEHIRSNSFSYQKPLYKRLEEKYHEEVEVLNNEKRKIELAKIKLNRSSISRKDLAEHMKWYESVKDFQTQKLLRESHDKFIENKLASYDREFSSTLGQKLYKENQIELKQVNTSLHTRLELVEKTKKYAKLVKELHPPRVIPHISVAPPENPPEKRLKESVSFNPRKFKKNSLLPDPSPKLEGKVFDYLAQQRKIREATGPLKHLIAQDWSEDSSFVKISKIKRFSNQIDHQVKQREIILQSSKSLSSIEMMKLGASVNSMLVSSIKAKLEALDVFNN